MLLVLGPQPGVLLRLCVSPCAIPHPAQESRTGLGLSFLICPGMMSIFALFCFLVLQQGRDGGRAKSPKQNSQPTGGLYVSLQKGVNVCGDRGSKRDEMSWLVRHTLPSCVFFIFGTDSGSTQRGTEGTSRNILTNVWLPHAWSLSKPMGEASGRSFRDWRTLQCGPWPQAPASCYAGHGERERERERSNLLHRVSSKIWIHRPLRISLVLSLDHSVVRPFQAG